MKRFVILISMLVLAAAALMLPSYAASGTVTSAAVSFGQAELPEGAIALGAVYNESSKMLHVAEAEDRHGEICISMPIAYSAEMTNAKLFILQGNTFIPLQTVTTTEAPATPEAPAPSSPDVLATVVTGTTYTEVTTLAKMLSAIDASGNSVVTLHKDIDTRSLRTSVGKSIISVPYSCTIDFNGHTVIAADDSGKFTAGDHGIKILAAGSRNKTTTLKNGRVVGYELAVLSGAGSLVADNMTLDCFYGATVALRDGNNAENIIRNSRLSSGGWGCISFNGANTDFSGTSLTIENSSLVSCNMYNPGTTINGINTSPVFVRQSTAANCTVTLGENVDLYSYNALYAADNFGTIAGKPASLYGETAAVTVNGKTFVALNRWSTTPEQTAPAASDITATVVTGTHKVEAATLAEMLSAIDATGNSVVTLHKDIDTRSLSASMITLPYSCTVDFNGHTVTTADETFAAGDHGIKINAAGTKNKITTLKNGTLISYEVGVYLSAGGLVLDSMTLHNYYGACLCLYDNGAYAHTIKNSTLSSANWGCIAFNKSNTDFSSASLTIENSTLISSSKSGSPIFVKKSGATPAPITFGSNVDLYTRHSSYAAAGYDNFAGKTPVQKTKTATVMVNGVSCSNITQWSTASYDYMVGYGKADITPEESVPLAGYGSTSNRMSTDNYTNLYVTATAVTDRAGESAILMSMDLINARYSMTSEIRSGIHAATGIDPNRIMVTYSHSHSTPDLSNTSATAYMKEYIPMVVEQAIAAGIAAWNDRQAAEMYAGSITVPDLNFTRHVLRKNGDITGIGFGSSSSPIQEAIGEVDTGLRLIRFVRGGSRDIVLTNWQAHATMNSYNQPKDASGIWYKASADYVHGFRYYVENTLGCNFSYFQGGAGNLMPTSLISGETPTTDIYRYGELVGAYMKSCLQNNMQKIAAGPIRSDAFVFRGRVNHEGDSMYEDALKVQAGEATYKELGFINSYHVSSVIRCYGKGDYIEERCTVLSIGAVGFAAMPHELFSETGMQIQQDSPFHTTFILAYSNDANGYLPTSAAYEYDSYEEACTSFAQGSAEELAEAFAGQWSAICP